MGEVKNFFYYLFHYKKIIEELRALREKDQENQLIVANYNDKIKRLEKENYRLGKYNDALEKECNEMFNHKDEKVIMSIHLPASYGEKIIDFTNYGKYTFHDRLDLSKVRTTVNEERDTEKNLGDEVL